MHPKSAGALGAELAGSCCKLCQQPAGAAAAATAMPAAAASAVHPLLLLHLLHLSSMLLPRSHLRPLQFDVCTNTAIHSTPAPQHTRNQGTYPAPPPPTAHHRITPEYPHNILTCGCCMLVSVSVPNPQHPPPAHTQPGTYPAPAPAPPPPTAHHCITPEYPYNILTCGCCSLVSVSVPQSTPRPDTRATSTGAGSSSQLYCHKLPVLIRATVVSFVRWWGFDRLIGCRAPQAHTQQ